MKKTFVSIFISLSLAVILIILAEFGPYQLIELKLYDLRMNLRKRPAINSQLLLVEMDEQAINDLGRWPWPRDINAKLIDTLHSLGAQQVLFDVTFANPAQLVIAKEKAKSIFPEEESISGFVAQVAEAVEKGEVADEDIAWHLNQISEGLDAFRETSQTRLAQALLDTDQIFAQSLQDRPVLIGYKFEVLPGERQIKEEAGYQQLKKDILAWIKNNPQKEFTSLSPSLKHSRHFRRGRPNELFLRLKLYSLLEKNMNLTLGEAASRLKQPAREARPYFNSAREDLRQAKACEFITQNPKSPFRELIWHYQIHDAAALSAWRRVWQARQDERKFSQKFGLAIKTKQNFLPAIEIDPPLADLSAAAGACGFLNGIPDRDGVLRTIPLFVKYQDKLYPHMSMASILELLKPEKISFIPKEFCLLRGAQLNNQAKDIYIPLDRWGRLLINWAGPWEESFSNISCSDIYRLWLLRKNTEENLAIPRQELTAQEQALLDDDLKRLASSEEKLKQTIQGRICVIGLTAPGTHDYNPIPYQEAYPMVGTHANVINSILNQQFLTKGPKPLDWVILVVLALILGGLLSVLPSLGGLLASLLAIILLCGAYLLLFNQGLWLNLASPLLLSLFSYLGITSYKFASEEQEKRWIKKAFSQYVAKDVIEEILKDPSKLKLGGERRTLTVLFSDVRSFTSYSEKRKPEEVVAVLNEYLDEMTKVIFDNKGTLDKYVGDEIMAIFGAPHYEEPQACAQWAVKTAWQMMERLGALREKWLKEGTEPLDIGIGINTGEMVVGNMGSSLVMDYTVIGDAVNLGARIEALTRQYNNHIIISEFTYEYVKDMVEVKKLEPIKVKGKEMPVMTYELLSLKA